MNRYQIKVSAVIWVTGPNEEQAECIAVWGIGDDDINYDWETEVLQVEKIETIEVPDDREFRNNLANEIVDYLACGQKREVYVDLETKEIEYDFYKVKPTESVMKLK